MCSKPNEVSFKITYCEPATFSELVSVWETTTFCKLSGGSEKTALCGSLAGVENDSGLGVVQLNGKTSLFWEGLA